jgi:sugar phosphate isomerase/epimerase
MIYISSRCINTETIRESVKTLAKAGFKNIELSGGTNYSPNYKRDLLRLQDKYELNYQVHNYFPPPTKPFVLNLASLDDDVREQSIQLCKKAIRLSKILSGKRYGVHAGFLIDIKLQEIGKKIDHRQKSKKNNALKKFANSWKQIGDEADGELSLYIENNVFSSTNAKTYFGSNPFLLTNYEGYKELKEYLDFNLLLDVAHLKVSANTLSLDFEDELGKLFKQTDYIHLSDNDGLHDQNRGLNYSNNQLEILSKLSFKDKTCTLETYTNMKDIRTNYSIVKNTLMTN